MNSPITVVVVDDDLLVRRHVQQLLGRRRDLRVAGTFGNGREALNAMAGDPPDIALVDILMPAMGGPELTTLIRKHHPSVHVLAFTSLADDQSLSDMLNAGAAGVVHKEASIDVVADALRATCAGLSVFSSRFNQQLKRPQLDSALSDTETLILRLISRGMSNEQIGLQVGLSPNTVKYHLNKLCEKLGTHNRVTLAVAAVRLGIDR